MQQYKWQTCTFTVSNSGVVSTGDLYTGWNDSTPSGTINIGDGLNFSGGTSIYNGGTSGVLTASFGINTSSRGAYTINFNGGTLKANSSVATLYSGGNGPGGANNGTTSWLPGGYFTAVVNAAGGIIDNGGNSITIGQSFAHGTGSPDGGLLFQGTGVTKLTGSSSYTGPTSVQNGTLVIAGALSPSTTMNALNGGTLLLEAATNPTGPINVFSGGTFSGSGSVGKVSVNSGGNVGIGLVSGGLTASALAYTGTGSLTAYSLSTSAANLTVNGGADHHGRRRLRAH